MDSSLESVLKSVKDELGQNSAYVATDTELLPPKQFISTQCLPIDLAIGRPGIPVGLLTLIYGPESQGKSTLGLHILAETQSIGGLAILFDTEYSFDVDRATAIGINCDELLIVNKNTMEEYFDSLSKLMKVIRSDEAYKDVPITVVWDSLAATAVDRDTADKDKFYELGVANQARVVSSSLRKIMSDINQNRVALVILNQLRENIGVMYGPKEVLPGGRATKFWSSLSLRTKKIGDYEQDKKKIGIVCNISVEKNRLAPPFKEVAYAIRFDTGIDKVQGLLDGAIMLGVMSQKSGWYSFNAPYDDKYGSKGVREKDAYDMIAENQELRDDIWKKAWQ